MTMTDKIKAMTSQEINDFLVEEHGIRITLASEGCVNIRTLAPFRSTTMTFGNSKLLTEALKRVRKGDWPYYGSW